LLRFIKNEILVIFATCSTEADDRQAGVAGCVRTVVGLVLPTGYTFNTDGTSIYLALTVVFIAQATNMPLSIGDEITLMAGLLLGIDRFLN
jgi:aerobic C4-dicarboxylate transport protein